MLYYFLVIFRIVLTVRVNDKRIYSSTTTSLFHFFRGKCKFDTTIILNFRKLYCNIIIKAFLFFNILKSSLFGKRVNSIFFRVFCKCLCLYIISPLSIRSIFIIVFKISIYFDFSIFSHKYIIILPTTSLIFKR